MLAPGGGAVGFVRKPADGASVFVEDSCQPNWCFAKDVVNGWLEADAFTLACLLRHLLDCAATINFYSHRVALPAVVEGLTTELTGVIGPSGSDAISQMLNAAGTGQPEGWIGLVGIAVLLFAATGFVGSLQDALDRIWDAPPRPGGIWSFIRSKLFSFSLVLAAAFLLLVSLLLSTAVTAFAGSFASALVLARKKLARMSPSQVYFGGIWPSCSKAGEVRVMGITAVPDKLRKISK